MRDVEASDRVAQVEGLLEQVEQLGDPVAHETATALVRATVELYGAGLERIVAAVAERDDGELAAAFATDELISHLLLLHDLHPVALEDRVRAGLAQVRPYLESHGGDVELLEIAEGVVRLRMNGSCSGCPSSAATLKLAIEDAIYKLAPDVVAIEAQDGDTEARDAGSAEPAVLQLGVAPALEVRRAAAQPNGRHWSTVAGLEGLASGESVVCEVAGEQVLFVRLTQATYAYRPRCPACGGSLANARPSAGCLICPDCMTHYDVRRAGRCPDHDELMLEPVPLLRDAGGAIRVALAAGVPA